MIYKSKTLDVDGAIILTIWNRNFPRHRTQNSKIHLYILISMCFYSRPQIAGSVRAELFKGTACGLRAFDIGCDVRRLLEISRNREEAKRWDWTEESEWGCKRSSPTCRSSWLLTKACPAIGRRRSDLHIYSTTKTHRIDGKHRNILSTATVSKNHSIFWSSFT